MELILKKDSEKIWVLRAGYKAKNAKDFIDIARIKKDGYFYKRDAEISGGFRRKHYDSGVRGSKGKYDSAGCHCTHQTGRCRQ